MRWTGLMLAAVVAGCGAQPAPDAAEATRAAQARACSAATAAHVGKSVDAVTAAYAGTTATGTALFDVTDEDVKEASGERVHVCEVDADARVLALRHTGR